MKKNKIENIHTLFRDFNLIGSTLQVKYRSDPQIRILNLFETRLK